MYMATVSIVVPPPPVATNLDPPQSSSKGKWVQIELKRAREINDQKLHTTSLLTCPPCIAAAARLVYVLIAVSPASYLSLVIVTSFRMSREGNIELET